MKIIRAILFVLLTLYFVLVIISEIDAPDKELHLIPEDFRGIVYIVHNRADGEPLKYGKSGRRIYEIPNNGILKTKAAPNTGGFSGGDLEFRLINKKAEKSDKLSWFMLFTTNEINFEELNPVDTVIITRYNHVSSYVIKDSLGGNPERAVFTAYAVEHVDTAKILKKYSELTIESLE